MTVFLHELRSYRKNTILWIISLSATAALFLSAFPMFSESSEDIKKLFAGFPQELLKAFGMNVSIMFSIVGFYAFIFTYILISGSIQAMYLGLSLVSRENNRKTADFLFTKPVSRATILTSKIMSGVVLLIITDIIFTGAAYIIAGISTDSPIDGKLFLMISATLFFVEMMFFSLGILVSTIARRIKPVPGIAMGTVFGFFVAGMLSSVLDEEKIKYFVPLYYYEGIEIINKSVYDTTFLTINILFVIGAIIASYIIYIKKDIHSV